MRLSLSSVQGPPNECLTVFPLRWACAREPLSTTLSVVPYGTSKKYTTIPELGLAYRRGDCPLIVLVLGGIRHLIPGTPVELPAAGLRFRPSPLLEEECGTRCLRLSTYVPDPLRLDGSVPAARFPADDNPVDALEVEVQGTNQGLAREETDRCRSAAQVIDAADYPLILDRCAEPDVRER